MTGFKHGGCGTPEYAAWHSMKDRCYNPNNKRYPIYGGRGIRVCPQWGSSFVNFLADMGDKPSSQHSLERVDNNKGYYKGNCRWATREDQAQNKRVTRFIEYQGELVPLSKLASDHGMKRSTLWNRLYQLGWPLGRALSEPLGNYRDHREGV